MASVMGRWICAAAHFAGERGSQGPGTTDYQTQRQKNRGGLWVLTGGFWWPETSRRWVVGEVRRRDLCGGRGRVTAGVLRDC